jgi:hypothetical protein
MSLTWVLLPPLAPLMLVGFADCSPGDEDAFVEGVVLVLDIVDQ